MYTLTRPSFGPTVATFVEPTALHVLGMDDASVSISNRFISRRAIVVIVFVTIVSTI